MAGSIVITGIGMVTPLGHDPPEVLRRLNQGQSAAASTAFDSSPFACRVCAAVPDFRIQDYTSELKMIRLMNRDAQFAVAAARLAMKDAGLNVGRDYQPEEVALFGATGLAGLPLREVEPLIRRSIGREGRFDLACFGQEGLRAISPLLSFKVLGNMPVCFVSITENLQGPNGIYTPWEGQGAQAIAAGLRALNRGRARAALVGGCDVKTHELAFIALEQLGLFQAWKLDQKGPVPGEGAVFLVLERAEDARERGASPYARIAGFSMGTARSGRPRTEIYLKVLTQAARAHSPWPGKALVAAADSDPGSEQEEWRAVSALPVLPEDVLRPKRHIGNLYAAAAALQVALGAVLARQSDQAVLANCFGFGSEQAAFLLEMP